MNTSDGLGPKRDTYRASSAKGAVSQGLLEIVVPQCSRSHARCMPAVDWHKLPLAAQSRQDRNFTCREENRRGAPYALLCVHTPGGAEVPRRGFLEFRQLRTASGGPLMLIAG